ncbi:unnamed protein product [Sphagnum jensenii]|uniref:Uncharacterized protein n=1 Tax=Sphagnum jensenii TaxID=128206 RepID=A0ABP0VFV6_9BRYO
MALSIYDQRARAISLWERGDEINFTNMNVEQHLTNVVKLPSPLSGVARHTNSSTGHITGVLNSWGSGTGSATAPRAEGDRGRSREQNREVLQSSELGTELDDWPVNDLVSGIPTSTVVHLPFKYIG